MNQPHFTQVFGWVFEHSPWVAEESWKQRPFSTLADLHLVMVHTVENAPFSKQLDLLRAHPKLAARVPMTSISKQEQSGVGLDRLTQTEYDEFLSLNQAYQEKFNFPFIMAVRGQSKEKILIAIKERLKHSVEVEFKQALQEIYQIARFRLNDIVKEGS
ncbi:2-oxo-4-hydroxy-4-carboxy-5-ureidoimidazoline decarboxylase [Thermoflavimicrobium daqui]|uniref:2-oxo-4-hydroxy-4-carboxy-5-ureidoimidazoline decarboxylase n=1 Tax=Thermoflavimicrobium daqui TaxID=2137476 RepID=UPI0030B85AA1